MPNSTHPVSIPGTQLRGDLCEVAGARGLVIIANGSGAGRLGRRNMFVAHSLQRRQLSTLLLDLLQRAEAEDPKLALDAELQALRLLQAVDTMQGRDLPIGLLGADTGAAAALIVAAQRPRSVHAVVSRGGRPDLAGPVLADVRAPTLLIVGTADPAVLDINRQALAQLRCVKQLEMVSRATHLFDEAGALEEVARLSSHWFETHLSPAAPA